MARLFVYSNNLASRVELELSELEEGAWTARCSGCSRAAGSDPDLLAGERERFNLNDAIEAARMHADGCMRCADTECRNALRHDAGHRCRK